MSVTHFSFGLTARNCLFNRFSYLCTCWPRFTHWRRRRTSDNNPYFSWFWAQSSDLFEYFCLLTTSIHVDSHRSYLSCADIPRFPLPQQHRDPSLPDAFKAVVTTSGYPEEFAHNRYWVFSPVTVNDGVLCLWPHFLSVDCRKSCINFTSILSRLFSYLYSCSVFAGFLPRNFGAPLAAFLRCRFSRLWTGRSPPSQVPLRFPCGSSLILTSFLWSVVEPAYWCIFVCS